MTYHSVALRASYARLPLLQGLAHCNQSEMRAADTRCLCLQLASCCIFNSGRKRQAPSSGPDAACASCRVAYPSFLPSCGQGQRAGLVDGHPAPSSSTQLKHPQTSPRLELSRKECCHRASPPGTESGSIVFPSKKTYYAPKKRTSFKIISGVSAKCLEQCGCLSLVSELMWPHVRSCKKIDSS